MTEKLDDQNVATIIPSLTVAMELSWRGSGLAAKEVAYSLGIDYCHFVRMFRTGGGRHFPPDLIPLLMEVSGNTLPLEWLASRMGQAVYPLPMMEVISGIKESLLAEGRIVHFALRR